MSAIENSQETRRMHDPRWIAVTKRDPAADGRFVYAVSTTGVYCRPTCPSRRARREHVSFHAGPADAERAGYRACKRCRPDLPSLAERQGRTVAALCRFIEEAEHSPGLEELAGLSGWSTWHLQRVFKAVTGLSPKSYAAARRGARLKRALEEGPTVTAALYAAGFGSGSRLYEQSESLLGMSPGSYRKGGAGNEIRFALGQCWLGAILVAHSGKGICAILLGDDPQDLLRELQERFSRATLVGDDRSFEQLVARVVGLVEAPARAADLPLDIRGTAFQCRVWEALRRIPPGQTLSYAELARRIGAPKAVRAVAGACAANALAVAIPCHRVVRSDGGLSGYRWGVERKGRLLEREAEAQ